ncbi:MAG: cell envelope integrity protein CreD, partial [Bacteroidota bacterium]
MRSHPSGVFIAFRIWLLTSACFTAGWGIYSVATDVPLVHWPITLLAGLVALIGSAPILVVLFITLPFIKKRNSALSDKFSRLLLTCATAILPYAIIGSGLLKPAFEKDDSVGYVLGALMAEALLLTAAGLAILFSKNVLHQYFQHLQNNNIMEPNNNTNYGTLPEPMPIPANPGNGNKNVIKAFITGGLILLMLIPSLFVSNLVTERETRQQEVTNEISSKWSAPQTLTGPYLAIPYTVHYTDSKGVASTLEKFFFILPENLQVTGSMTPEVRPRSIYKVYLYKSQIKQSGNFQIRLPKNVSLADVRLKDATICFGIRDFKGIEEAIRVQIKGQSFEMTPGLPTRETETVIETNSGHTTTDAVRPSSAGRHQEIESIGLSANIPLTETDINQTLSFDLPIKINGSQHLHFIPLAGNSEYRINGSWSNPKFDGNNLPGTRVVADSGFNARWTFNKANLPFSTLLEDF